MDDGSTCSSGEDTICSCKIGRNIRSYDLDKLNEKIHEQREDGASLRELETFVNQHILQQALKPVGENIIADEDSIYEALSDDSVSAGRRTEIRERLSRAGVDVDTLTSDFVSYQTVRTHLRDCLDVDTNRTSDLSIADARGTIEWARSRDEGIIERTLERLEHAQNIDTGEIDVSHIIRVSCSECDTTLPIGEFLDQGGCDCR